MMEMVYCGKPYQGALRVQWICGSTDGACPSCLREHVARLEARNAELEDQAAAQAGGVAVVELLAVEKFADNGAHSHWIIIRRDTGEAVWEEPDPEDSRTEIPLIIQALPASRVLGEEPETIKVCGVTIRNGCGSNSCHVRKPARGTNGPCQCLPGFLGTSAKIKIVGALRAAKGGRDVAG